LKMQKMVKSKHYKKDLKSAIDEIFELSSACIKCGMCKKGCPIFEVFTQEQYGPRAKNQIFADIVRKYSDADGKANEDVDAKDRNRVFNLLVAISYTCSLCNNCKIRCPLNINLKELFRDFRNYLVENGFEAEVHKQMIENVRKYGNPFGETVKGDQFYCC